MRQEGEAVLRRRRLIQLIAWSVFWFSVTFLAFLFFSTHYLDSDEGAILNIAWQLWYGKQLYVDFIEFVTPGSGYLLFWAWELFGGPSYVTAKVVSILFWIFSAIGMALIVRRFVFHKLLIVVAVLAWMIATDYYALINHNTYSSFLGVWFVYVTLVLLEKRTVWLSLLTGVVGAGVFLLLQTKGLALFGAALLLLFFNVFLYKENSVGMAWGDRMKQILIALCSWIGTVLLFTVQWDVSTVLESWFVLPSTLNYLGYTLVYSQDVVLEIVIVALMILGSWLMKKKEFVVLVVFQVALFLSGVNLVDRAHLMINLFPFILFVVLTFNHIFVLSKKFWGEEKVRWVRLIITLGLLFALLDVLVQGILLHFEGNTIYNLDLVGRKRPGVFSLQEVQQAKYVYAGPFLPGFYFELGKENPFTQMHNMTLCPEECQKKTVETFKELQPEFALLNYAMVAKYGYSRGNFIDEYIQEQYIDCEYSTGALELYALHECPIVNY